MKRCIYHVPFYVDSNWISASHIRPIKMLEAFKRLGYEVDIVMGYASERKRQIKEIKDKIKSGVKYDFLYSESSTMPTLLTEKHHLPIYPFLDFGFMKYCKRQHIKIGLFYRDIYWKFDDYKEKVSILKRSFATLLYEYDLRKYAKLLDVLYVPSLRESKYLEEYGLNSILRTLPPGTDVYLDSDREKNETYLGGVNNNDVERKIELIYVGGIGGVYDLKNILDTAIDFPSITYNICVRERDWDIVKVEYAKYHNQENVRVHHVSGSDLESLLDKADIAFTTISNDLYYEMSLPYKLFEYIAHSIPVIGPEGTAIGDFIETNDCGWTVDVETDKIKKLIMDLSSNPKDILDKSKKAFIAAKENTWLDRAKQVEDDLSD